MAKAGTNHRLDTCDAHDTLWVLQPRSGATARCFHFPANHRFYSVTSPINL